MYRKSFRLTNQEIDDAFATRQFRLVFQPKIDLHSHELAGVESFARWQHPQFGVIPPALFLPVLARQGRNQELTRFVLAEAIAQLVRARATNQSYTVSVNVAPEELTDGSLPISIRLALNTADLDPSRLVIDLPERGLAADPDRAADTIHALAEIGVGLAMECAQEPLMDFSAADPKTLDPSAFNEFKIGGRAIIQFASRIEGTGLGLMRSRLEYAKAHGLRTTAVGAETAETVKLLPDLGFELAQGNAISPPVTPQSLIDFDANASIAALMPDAEAAGTGKPDLEDFHAPSETAEEGATRPQPRIRVRRGKARVELQVADEQTGTTHIVKLPGPGDAEDHEQTSRTLGFLARLQNRIGRVLQN